jgi:hypothetical protein
MSDIPNRIEKLIGRTELNDFEKTFLPSIKDYYTKKNLLTPGQLSVLEKLEAKYSDEARALHDEWLKTWDEKKKLAFKTMVAYYKGEGGYYSTTVKKLDANPDYVPTQKEYSSIVENKYAQRYLNNLNTPARFTVGDLVMVRSNAGWYHNEMCVVLNVGNYESWAKGSRQYTVSMVNDGRQTTMLENQLKFVQQSGLDKKKQQAV